MPPPPFLHAFDNPLELDDSPGWVADCPRCRMLGQPGALVHIHPVDGWWRLDCDGDGCTHDAITAHLQLRPAQLRVHTDNWDQRLHRALTLAPTLNVCEALLRGEHVPTGRLDPHWLRAYRRKHRP